MLRYTYIACLGLDILVHNAQKNSFSIIYDIYTLLYTVQL
jgi:hypothetical protein